MERFMIHAVPERMWYIDGYLIPSMEEQGIRKEDIVVWCDNDHIGNLKSWLASCRQCAQDADTVYAYWHMQDDVVISRSFAEKIRSLHDLPGVVCGFGSCYDRKNSDGLICPAAMWFSFQCIRIPNEFMPQFLRWFDRHKVWYDKHVRANKYDDMFFMKYMQDMKKQEYVLNLAPNIVDHVDFLLGGTTINHERKYKTTRSCYWTDEAVVWELAKKLGREKEYYEAIR